MTTRKALRRFVPDRIREASSEALHGIAGSLYKQSMLEDLSERQEWLWTVVICELEHRSTNAGWRERCSCAFCIPPFPDTEQDY